MMITEEKITLTSGREVTIKPLTVRQRAKIKDEAFRAFNRGITVSLENSLDAVIYATGLRENELEQWDDQDIYECGAEVFNRLYIPETDKKK